MKKTIVFNLLFVLCLLFLFSSNAYASGSSIKEYFSGGNSKLDIDNFSSGVYSVLKAFGVVLAVCIMTTMAIQWFLATPNKKAILKERFIYYFAGVIFLLAGITFLNWYEGVAKEVASSFAGSGGGTYSPKPQTQNTQIGQGSINEEGKFVYFDETTERINVALDKSLKELNLMSYNELKDYVNQLDDDKGAFKKYLDEGKVEKSSGYDHTLEMAEDRLEYSKKLLKEKYDQLENT